MQWIRVERWTFLAGIVSFVVAYGLAAFYGWQYNPYSGLSYDPFPAALLVPIVLFVLSFVLGARASGREEGLPAAAGEDG